MIIFTKSKTHDDGGRWTRWPPRHYLHTTHGSSFAPAAFPVDPVLLKMVPLMVIAIKASVVGYCPCVESECQGFFFFNFNNNMAKHCRWNGLFDNDTRIVGGTADDYLDKLESYVGITVDLIWWNWGEIVLDGLIQPK